MRRDDLAASRSLPLHFVWIGGGRLPLELLAGAESWRRYNPRLRLTLWTDGGLYPPGPWHDVRPIDGDWLCNADLYARVHEWTGEREAVAARADLIRLEVVARFGGIYADLDVRCMRCIDPLLRGVRLFCADEWGPNTGNFLFGAVPNHPAMWTAVRELRYSFWRHTRRPRLPRRLLLRARYGARRTRWLCRPRPAAVNPVLLCGPRYLNAKIAGHPDCVLFPYQLFNPLSPWCDPAQVSSWPASAFGNHDFAGTWYDREKGPPPPEFLR